MMKRRWFYGIAAVWAAVFSSCFLFEGEEAPSKPAAAEKTYAITVAETEHGSIIVPARAVPGSKVAIQAVPEAGKADVDVQGGGDWYFVVYQQSVRYLRRG
jgi:hypothetical protein